MLFPTVEFAIFFLAVFYLSWALRHQLMARKIVLLAASYLFYGFWDWRFLFLLAETSIVNYALGIWLAKPLEEATRRRLLFAGVAFNLCVLGFFKYWGFFLSNFYDLLSSVGLAREWQIWEVLLPMGISFFTFQGISYVVDVYRKEIPSRQSLIDVLLYISFFPQLVAGPIVRASSFMPQLDREPDADAIRATRALILIGIGLFKKVVIAHYVAVSLVEPAFSAPNAYGTLDLLFGVYGYAVQIYCDFSAYSDMAIGFAALLGFHFDLNFRQPYRALNLSDFWHRWHISLSQWLRDYLYIPLGGSRGSRWQTYRNLLLTMLLGGLWHGAAWTFVIWGAIHGVGLAAHRMMNEAGWLQRFRLRRIESILLTFHFVCLAWIFFHAAHLNAALTYLAGLARWDLEATLVTPFTTGLLVLGLVGQFVPEDLIDRLEARLDRVPLALQGAGLGFAIVLLSAMGPGTMAPFIYFRF